MQYIEIAEGLSVKICDICAVGKDTDLTSTVYTDSSVFKSTFPYNVLLELLERESDKPVDNTQQRQLRILETLGTFAG